MRLPSILLCVSLAGCCVLQCAGEECGGSGSGIAKKRPKVLWIGDSLTEFGDNATQPGWLNLLAWQYTRKADMVNRGLSGYTSRQVLQVADELLSDSTAAGARLAVVWLGANDAKLRRWFERNSYLDLFVPVTEYKSNLRALVNKIKRAGVSRVLLATPPPLIESWMSRGWMLLGQEAYEDRTNANGALYGTAVKQLGSELGVPVVDMAQQLRSKPGFGKRMYIDALHFSGAGQKAVFEVLRDAIAANFPDMRPEALPLHWPPVRGPKRSISSSCIADVWRSGQIYN